MRPVTTTTSAKGHRTRLTPDQRRTQLLDLGVSLLATRSLDELTIDVLAEEAGISRGLLYHYFGNKHDFREAVVRRAVADLIEQTAPPEGGEPLDRLLASVTAYVDYVVANYQGYVSIVRGAAGGNETLRQMYQETRDALTDRIFTEDAQGEIIPDTPAARLMVRGWSAMGEEMVLTWVADPRGVTRDQLLESIAASLPALVELLH
jgi:AcrR family transcriptional regulator